MAITSILKVNFGGRILIDGDEFLRPHQSREVNEAAVRRAQLFQREVWAVLVKIRERWAGWAVQYRILTKTLRIVTIKPQKRCVNIDPRTIPWNEQNGSTQDITYPKDGHSVTGTGKGTRVTIRYNPLTFANPHCMAMLDAEGRYRPDDALLHELVHALRLMQGKADHRTVKGFDTFEDFIAILITNIYVSECGRPEALRASHASLFELLTGRLADQQPYWKLYQEQIAELCRSMPGLTKSLADAKADFNPIRIHYEPELQREPIFSGPRGDGWPD